MFLCFYVRQRTTSDYLRLTLPKIPLLLTYTLSSI